MNPETVERMLNAADQAAQRIGWKNYDDMARAIQEGAPIIRFYLDFFGIMRTRSIVAAKFSEKEEVEPELVDFFIRFLTNLPGALGSAVRDAAKSETLPPEPKGRHPIDARKRQDICNFVLGLHGKKGLSERAAKDRAAQHFSVSRRSVDRIWKAREETLKDPEIAREMFARFNELVRAYHSSKESKTTESE